MDARRCEGKKGGVLMVRICAVADVSVGERKYLSFLCLFVCKENDEWLELSLRNYEKGLLINTTNK